MNRYWLEHVRLLAASFKICKIHTHHNFPWNCSYSKMELFPSHLVMEWKGGGGLVLRSWVTCAITQSLKTSFCHPGPGNPVLLDICAILAIRLLNVIKSNHITLKIERAQQCWGPVTWNIYVTPYAVQGYRKLGGHKPGETEWHWW